MMIINLNKIKLDKVNIIDLGAFATVLKGINKKTKEIRAIKKISKLT